MKRHIPLARSGCELVFLILTIAFNFTGADELPPRVAAAVSSCPGHVGVAAWIVERPESRIEVRAEETFNLGSLFKVNVLAELAMRASTAEVSLKERATLDRRVASLPSGLFQEFDDGLQPTLSDLAKVMIRLSDNTATDMLIERLGQDSIEAHLSRFGTESTPHVMPTKTLFLIAAGLSTDLSDAEPIERARRWTALPRAEQRAVLRRTLEEGRRVPYDEFRKRAFAFYGGESVTYAQQAALSHAIDWSGRPAEYVELMARAAAGTLVNPETSETFLRYLTYGGAGIIGMQAPDSVVDIARKGGSDIGIVTDCGVMTLSDGRHLAIGVFTDSRPQSVSEGEMYPKMAAIARACIDALAGRPTVSTLAVAPRPRRRLATLPGLPVIPLVWMGK